VNERTPNVKTYLGDSVYADSDGHMITLTTENGGPPSNTIYLEPEVYESLVKFVTFVMELKENSDG